MEAGNPKRAALRLAAFGGGVLLTIGLVVATARLRAVRPSPAPRTSATAAPTAPSFESLEPTEPYRLPLTETGRLATTAVSTAPLRAPSYEPPLASALDDRFQDPAPDARFAPPTPALDGSLTIHNPAAFGPPEDDIVPPIPAYAASRSAEQRVAPEPIAARRGPARMPAPPVTPLPGEWDESLPLIASEEPAMSGTSLAERIGESKPRTLRELEDPDREAIMSYTASTNDLSRRLASEVQAGFQLGKAGAVYAARAKFIGVLRRIAMAKDADEGTTHHAEVLAEGLRTLDEADDFVPKGDALEAELDVTAIARSHGVRLVNETGPVAAHEAIARYSQHAARRLAEAAANEPAGSMALYGLGKTYARLEEQEADPYAGRKCAVMYRAAIDTHEENFLAANELGVRLARVGRYEQASRVLRRAAEQPSAIATVHANLAAIERRLGRDQAAAVAQQQSARLAQRESLTGEVSRQHGVDWVDPAAFRQTTQPGPPAHSATTQQPTRQPTAPQAMAPGYAAAEPPAESGWSSFVRKAKQTAGWSPAETRQPTPSAAPVAANPMPVYR